MVIYAFYTTLVHNTHADQFHFAYIFISISYLSQEMTKLVLIYFNLNKDLTKSKLKLALTC